MMDSLPQILTWLVVFVALPSVWVEAFVLTSLLITRPENRVLRAQLLAQVFMGMVLTVFAAVFINNDMRAPLLNTYQTQVVTRLAMLSLVIPALYWLWQYRKWK